MTDLERMGAVVVLVPRTLMSVTGDERRLVVDLPQPVTLAELLDGLAARYPIFVRRIRDETGSLRRYVNVYLDGEDVRQLKGAATEVAPGQELQIIQSVAGG
jgi:molybdopterin synthase sulfur carrier subunit